jgi:hypothetical protein
MAPNRITRGGAKRRGPGTLTRRGLAAALAIAVILAALAGCGGGGTSSTIAATAVSAAPENSADAAVLDKVLGRQEAAAAAYSKVTPDLSPHLSHVAFYFRRQEEEHIDSVLKALRGLDSPAEPTPETIEPGELRNDRERLLFLYEVESATIDEELSAISKLEASWPRSLLASTVANQAQHLTVLRQALGAGPLNSVPVPFENGTAPPPG